MENLNSLESLKEREERKALFPFSLQQVTEIHRAGLTLDLLFVLEYLATSENENLEKYPKMAPYLQTLQRKELIDENLVLTKSGEEILGTIIAGESLVKAKKEKKAKVVTDFDRWWKAFPTSDAFAEAGYKATRELKAEKDKCVELIAQVLKEGEYTIDDLILATETEVAAKKAESIKSKQNKLSYITNSASWLRQRKYESWIEIAKTQPTQQSKKLNKSFDI